MRFFLFGVFFLHSCRAPRCCYAKCVRARRCRAAARMATSRARACCAARGGAPLSDDWRGHLAVPLRATAGLEAARGSRGRRGASRSSFFPLFLFPPRHPTDPLRPSLRFSLPLQVNPASYTDFQGYAHFAGGLACGMACLSAGLAIGIVGDAGVRANAQQSKLFIIVILILIFAEIIGLYGTSPSPSDMTSVFLSLTLLLPPSTRPRLAFCPSGLIVGTSLSLHLHLHPPQQQHHV